MTQILLFRNYSISTYDHDSKWDQVLIFEEKPYLTTAARSSSQRCKVRANGNWIVEPVGYSGTVQFYHMILNLTWHNSQPLCHPSAQTLRNTSNSFHLKCWVSDNKVKSRELYILCIDTSVTWIPGQVKYFSPVPANEALAGESEVVLGDTRNAAPHAAVVCWTLCSSVDKL